MKVKSHIYVCMCEYFTAYFCNDGPKSCSKWHQLSQDGNPARRQHSIASATTANPTLHQPVLWQISCVERTTLSHILFSCLFVPLINLLK